jgi:phosphate transporter
MKFGKQLEVTANVEWRPYYVQYKKLKRLIKRVAFAVERGQRKLDEKKQKDAASPVLPRPPDVNSPGILKSSRSKSKLTSINLNEKSPLLPSDSDMNLDGIADAKREFWEMTNLNIQIANDFYRTKITNIARMIKDFESLLHEEETSTYGHVTSRSFSRSISHESDRGLASIQDAYDTLVDLKQFVNLNHTGFRKIVKKFDKSTGENAQDSFMKQLNREDFYASNDIDGLLDRLFVITSRYTFFLLLQI